MQITELQTLKRGKTSEKQTFEIVDRKIARHNGTNGRVLCPVYKTGHITRFIHDGVYNGNSVLFWNADKKGGKCK